LKQEILYFVPRLLVFLVAGFDVFAAVCGQAQVLSVVIVLKYTITLTGTQ